MTRTVDVTRDELLTRRSELLAEHRTTLAEFMDRASSFALVGDEWETLDELAKISFLLGEDA